MAHPRETRLALRAAFIGGLPLEHAAAKAGVNAATARRWKAGAAAQGDDWDKFQAASLIVAGGGFDQALARVAGGVIMRCEALLERISATQEIDPLEATRAVASLSDSLAKAQAASKRMLPEVDRYGVATEVLKRLAEFALERAGGSAAQQLVDLIEAFGAELGTSGWK